MFLEHPLRYFKKNVDLTPSSTFFLELEFVELDVFGRQFCGVGEVELFFVEWSATKHPLNFISCRLSPCITVFTTLLCSACCR